MTEELFRTKESEIPCGLTDEQVNERVRQGLNNVAVVPPYKTGTQIVCSNIFTYFNFIFVFLLNGKLFV